MSNIPRARQRLRALFSDNQTCLMARKVEAIIVEDMGRRKGHYRALGTRAIMTRTLAQKIRSFAHAHLDWTQQRIAEKFNVTNGRVSEVLHGKNK